jgi:hypothetical protein
VNDLVAADRAFSNWWWSGYRPLSTIFQLRICACGTTSASISAGSGNPPAHESDEEEQNDRAGGGRDELPGEIATWEQSKLRQQSSPNDGADDADHDVADQSKPVTLDDDPGQEAGDRADQSEQVGATNSTRTRRPSPDAYR